MPMPEVGLVNVRDAWLQQGGDRPSLGLAYLASHLRQRDRAGRCAVRLWDMHHATDAALLDWVTSTRPRLLGISLTTPQYREAVRLARLIKAASPTTPIIAGGAHPTAVRAIDPDVMPRDCFDYVVTGEAEHTFAELCLGERLPTERIITGVGAATGKTLDPLAPPARDLLPMDRYSLTILGRRATPLMTSRGCPWHCTFCSEPLLNPRYRAHSAAYVVDEMRAVRDQWGIGALIIYDDVYVINARRVMEVSRRMMHERLDLLYRATTRSDDILRYPDLLPLLRDSGCVELCLGVESGSDAILRTNDKGMTVAKNREAIRRIKAAGIRVLTYMITGLPGCSEATERESFQFLTDTEPAECGWYLLAPFPSTPLWVERTRYGLAIFEDEIRANQWDVAQCQADNGQLTCYVDYRASGGLDRDQLKALWLEMRQRWEQYQRTHLGAGIQDAGALAANDRVGQLLPAPPSARHREDATVSHPL